MRVVLLLVAALRSLRLLAGLGLLAGPLALLGLLPLAGLRNLPLPLLGLLPLALAGLLPLALAGLLPLAGLALRPLLPRPRLTLLPLALAGLHHVGPGPHLTGGRRHHAGGVFQGALRVLGPWLSSGEKCFSGPGAVPGPDRINGC